MSGSEGEGSGLGGSRIRGARAEHRFGKDMSPEVFGEVGTRVEGKMECMGVRDADENGLAKGGAMCGLAYGVGHDNPIDDGPRAEGKCCVVGDGAGIIEGGPCEDFTWGEDGWSGPRKRPFAFGSI